MIDKLISKLSLYLKDKPNYERFKILHQEFNFDINQIKDMYPNELKTFEDLKFQPHPNSHTTNLFLSGEHKGVQSVLEFDNGHFVSVVGGMRGLYGDGKTTFEVGFPDEDGQIEVFGYLRSKEVSEAMFKIQMEIPFPNK